ncbi:MAG: hypothetical protein Q8S75_16250, partial [Nitrospirota bacterium]|nr:hypothetical protein [Nitrospirota bacterium]
EACCPSSRKGHPDKIIFQVIDYIEIIFLLPWECSWYDLRAAFLDAMALPWCKESRGGDVAITSPFFCLLPVQSVIPAHEPRFSPYQTSSFRLCCGGCIDLVISDPVFRW